MRRVGASAVVSSSCLLVALGACTDSHTVVREMELPLCPIVREEVPDGPPKEIAELGWLEDGEFLPFEADDGLCPGDPELAVCPVFNSWKQVTSTIAIRARGPDPRGVVVTIEWDLGPNMVGSQDFPTDLVCNGLEPVPLLLPISFGQEFGEPEDYRCLPGRVHVAVAPSGVDPRDCDDESCLVIDRDVVYTLFGE